MCEERRQPSSTPSGLIAGRYARDDLVASLGSKKNPALVRVQTETRARELLEQFMARGKHIIVELAPDQPEDVTDVERALSPPPAPISAPTIGRNEPCPCGSGKKFKKCCMGLRASFQS